MWLGFLPQRRSKSSKQSTMCKRECRQWRQTTREASENRLGENWMCKRKESLTFFPPIYFLMSSKLFPTRLNWMSSLSSRAHSRFIVMFSHPFYAMFIPVASFFLSKSSTMKCTSLQSFSRKVVPCLTSVGALACLHRFSPLLLECWKRLVLPSTQRWSYSR